MERIMGLKKQRGGFARSAKEGRGTSSHTLPSFLKKRGAKNFINKGLKQILSGAVQKTAFKKSNLSWLEFFERGGV